VHLNLTEGLPCAEPSRIRSLLTPQGLFVPGPARLASRLLISGAVLHQIELEFRAQIEKVRAARIEPTHLDGHQHVHMWPSIFALAARLAHEYGIPAMRSARERRPPLPGLLRRKGSTGGKILKQLGVAVALKVVGSGARKSLHRAGLAAPDYFYGVSSTGFLDAATLEAILRHLPEGASELMCHPGYADQALRASATRLVTERQAELDALTRPQIRNLARQLGNELITYRELGKKQFQPHN
jgi:predicted glycoside hydrolase/deacetylase ChbG (UPF0249 family)